MPGPRISIILAGLLTWLLFAPTPSHAIWIAGTSFEHEALAEDVYSNAATVATADPAVPVPLPNSETPLVITNSTAASDAAGDLGFSAAWFNTRNLNGVTEGDRLGVRQETFLTQPYPDGDRGYTISDGEGLIVLTFDPVDVSGYADVTVSVTAFLFTTDYEPEDSLVIEAQTDAGTVALIDTTTTGIEGSIAEGTFVPLTAALPEAATSVQVVVAYESNLLIELLMVDDIRIEAGTRVLPEPATSAALAWLAWPTRRRRRR